VVYLEFFILHILKTTQDPTRSIKKEKKRKRGCFSQILTMSFSIWYVSSSYKQAGIAKDGIGFAEPKKGKRLIPIHELSVRKNLIPHVLKLSLRDDNSISQGGKEVKVD
jgi:hypothetical protein